MSFFKKQPRRIFLDYASTTPVSSRAQKAMMPFTSRIFYNPSSLYKEGVATKKILEGARVRMARILNVTPSEIVFTGSGTESCNLALRGVYEEALVGGIQKPHIITSALEHSAVLEVCRDLERKGAEVTYVLPDNQGLIHSHQVISALRDNTVLVSIMYANNEIGVVEPVRDIVQVIKKIKQEKKSIYPYVHTDASQAFNYCTMHVDVLGVDLLTLDSSKVYGPKGLGVLMVKRKTRIQPIIHGGGQEGGLRSGTENMSAIVGGVEAFAEADEMRKSEVKRLNDLSAYFLQQIRINIPGVELNGHEERRLPNIINICIPGLDSEFAVLKLDALGVACAHVSACKSGDDNASYVIKSLNKEGCARSSLRFSLGRATTKKDLNFALLALKKIV